jgi:outer membrane immunogenic protein
MKTIVMLLATLAFGATCNAAEAATSMRLKAPATAADSVHAWSGWYAGAVAGYGFGSAQIDIDPISPGGLLRAGFVSRQLGDDPTGALGGLALGANKQVGSILYGFETDFSYSAIRAGVIGPFLITPFDFQTADAQKLTLFGTVRVRAGLVMQERSLIYATGGLAYAQARLSTFAIDTSADICGGPVKFCTYGSNEQWKAGWTLGAGWEYALDRNWSAKLEYLYYDLGTLTNFMTDGLTPVGNFHGATDIKGNIVRVGVNYLFGRL